VPGPGGVAPAATDFLFTREIQQRRKPEGICIGTTAIHAGITVKVLTDKCGSRLAIEKYRVAQYILQKEFVVVDAQQGCILNRAGKLATGLFAIITPADDFS